MPLAHNCAYAYLQGAEDPASGLDHHMPNTGSPQWSVRPSWPSWLCFDYVDPFCDGKGARGAEYPVL